MIKNSAELDTNNTSLPQSVKFSHQNSKHDPGSGNHNHCDYHGGSMRKTSLNHSNKFFPLKQSNFQNSESTHFYSCYSSSHATPA